MGNLSRLKRGWQPTLLLQGAAGLFVLAALMAQHGTLIVCMEERIGVLLRED
jgi:hypothetical protein